MNRFLQISNIVLIAAVAVLFILFFNNRNKNPKIDINATKTTSSKDSVVNKDFKIAYFELDSVEAKYKYYNQVKNNLIAKEKQVQNTLEGLQKRFESRLKSAQEKGPTLSQNEQAALQQELEGMQREYAQKDQNMKEELIMDRFKKLQSVNERIEKIAAQIAEEKGYSYVLSRYEGGENNIIYFRDKQFDITRELIERLNKDEAK